MKYAYHSSCESLSIYDFHKILETGEVRHLLMDPDQEIDEVLYEVLQKTWGNIYEEYCKLSEDNSSLLYYATCSEVIYLETRLITCSILVRQMVLNMGSTEIIAQYNEALIKWGYKINLEKDIEKELEKLIQVLKISENKIRLKKDELEQYKPDDSEKMSLTEQVVKLELALGKNEIDPKKTSVEKWITMIKEVSKKNELRKKASR